LRSGTIRFDSSGDELERQFRVEIGGAQAERFGQRFLVTLDGNSARIAIELAAVMPQDLQRSDFI